MKIIELHSVGDEWIKKDIAVNKMYSTPTHELVLFHTRFEGISLTASGILDVINTWVAETGRNPNTIQVDTPNQYEKIPYQFYNTRLLVGGYFFSNHLINYSKKNLPIDSATKLFGFFLGRYTSMRNTIAVDILNNYKTHFLMSVMKSYQLGSTNWWDPQVLAIGSLDDLTVPDQYTGLVNANQSLLQFYNDFQIELVIESVTLGKSFFPTEKTVRPIIGSKPFVTYAPINHLANLRDLGFKTFDQLWPEDYDQYEGSQRWHSMKSTISHIIEYGYDCDIANKIVKYNYTHLEKIIAKNG